MKAPPITEKQFSQAVCDMARIFGWLVYRTWSSIHSPAGFPDLVLVRAGRIVFAELKTDKGKLTRFQQQWQDALTRAAADIDYFAREGTNHDGSQAGVEVYVWRPADMAGIEKVLR